MIFIVSNMKEYENEKNCEITLPTNFAEWIENAVWINTHLSRFQISRCEVVDTVDKAQLRQFVVGLQKVWKLKYMKTERAVVVKTVRDSRLCFFYVHKFVCIENCLCMIFHWSYRFKLVFVQRFDWHTSCRHFYWIIYAVMRNFVRANREQKKSVWICYDTCSTPDLTIVLTWTIVKHSIDGGATCYSCRTHNI